MTRHDGPFSERDRNSGTFAEYGRRAGDAGRRLAGTIYLHNKENKE